MVRKLRFHKPHDMAKKKEKIMVLKIVLSKTWKQSKCPSRDESIKMM